MTVSSTTRKAGPFAGNGAATAFPFTFKVFDKTDIKLILVDQNGTSTTLVLDSDYSVALNSNQDSNPGGSITYPIVGNPLATGLSLVALGALEYEQLTDITNNGGFYPRIIEDMVDRATIQIQQLEENVSRAIVLNESESASPALPTAAGRANMLLGFDALGNVAVLPITTSVGAGDLRDELGSDGKPGFVAGTDFVAGTTTQLTLSRAPGSIANMWISFDGTGQGGDQIQSIVGQVLTFTAPIPLGTQRVYVRTGTTLSTQIPPDASVTTAKLLDGAVSDPKILTGSKTGNRRDNIVDVNDYNKSGNKAAYSFSKAVAYLATLGGGELWVPPGLYLFDASVDVPANVKIRGAGFNSVIRAFSSLPYVFRTTGGSSQHFDSLQIDGNSYLGGNGILNVGAAYVKVARVLLTGCVNGFQHQDNGAIVNGPTLEDVVSLNNTTGIYLQGGAINTQIDRLYHEGGDGIILDTATNHNEGTVIAKPIIKPSILNGSQGDGIQINGGLETQILGGVIDQVQTHGIVLNGATSGVVKTKVIGTWVGHRASPSAGGIGILVQGQVNDLNLISTTTAVSPTFGMQFQASGGNTPDEILLDGNMYLNHATGDVFNNGSAGHYKIKNNKFQHPTNNYQEGSNSIAADIDGNTFKAVPNSISTSSRIGKNYGLVTQSEGNATIASGATTVVVAHGLSFTPTLSDISLIALSVATNAVGDIGIQSITSTQFTIRVRNDPGASGITFGWKANINR